MMNKVIDQLFRRGKEKGYSALRYNTRGFGKSTGHFDEGVGEEKDLDELLTWVQNQGISINRITMVGYSFGSWITAKVLRKHPLPCVLVAPPVSMYDFPILNNNRQKFIFSATNDELIPFEKVLAYFELVTSPKHHIPIDDTGHYFIGKTNQLIQAIFQELEAFPG